MGEWHFHPFASPCPSSTDVNQVKNNSKSESYHCPEVVMFIVGGDPANEWTCSSLVYSRQKSLIKLEEGKEHNVIRD